MRVSHLHLYSLATHLYSLFLFQSLCMSSSKCFPVCCGKENKAGGKWEMHVNRDYISTFLLD